MTRTIKLAWRKLCSGLRALFFRMGKGVSIGAKPFFGHGSRIETEDGGTVTIAGGLHARGPFYLRAEHGGAISIGKDCFFNYNCSITALERVEIGEHCVFGNNLVVVDHDHNFRKIGEKDFVSSGISIGNRVWMGANVVVLRGTVVEDDAVIAAGSVVRGRVPTGTVYRSQQLPGTEKNK